MDQGTRGLASPEEDGMAKRGRGTHPVGTIASLGQSCTVDSTIVLSARLTETVEPESIRHVGLEGERASL